MEIQIWNLNLDYNGFGRGGRTSEGSQNRNGQRPRHFAPGTFILTEVRQHFMMMLMNLSGIEQEKTMRKKTAKLKNRIRAIKLNQTALDEILFGTLMNESLRLFDLTEKKMDGFCFRMLMNESRTEAIFYVCDDSLASNGLDFSKTDQFVRESTSLETTESIYEYCPNKTVYTEIAAETQEDGN